MQTLNILEAVRTFSAAWKSFIAPTNVNCFQRARIHMKATVMYTLSSKIENTQWAEKTTTTRCGITETATTWNFMLWLFLNNHDVG